MTEQQIQKKRIDQLEKEGYYVLKLVKTNKNGIPDIVAIPLMSAILDANDVVRHQLVKKIVSAYDKS